MVLFTELLRLAVLFLAKLEAKRGSRLADKPALPVGLLPTLDRDLVTGWLFANVVSILLRVEVLDSVLDPLSDTGSSDASGDVLGDVDIGEPAK